MTICPWCGVSTARHSILTVCATSERRRNIEPTYEHALTGGAWTYCPKRRVQVWVAAL